MPFGRSFCYTGCVILSGAARQEVGVVTDFALGEQEQQAEEYLGGSDGMRAAKNELM